MRVLCYEYKKNSIVPWYLNPNFFKPDLFIVYTGNKYKNMIVDLDEKIRNLNWIFRLRVSTHTHCSKKMAKLCNHKMCGVVFRVITSKVKNNIFLLKLLRNSPRHYSLLIALFSDFNTHYCEKSSNAITVILMVMVMMMHTAASTRIRRIVI